MMWWARFGPRPWSLRVLEVLIKLNWNYFLHCPKRRKKKKKKRKTLEKKGTFLFFFVCVKSRKFTSNNNSTVLNMKQKAWQSENAQHRAEQASVSTDDIDVDQMQQEELVQWRWVKPHAATQEQQLRRLTQILLVQTEIWVVGWCRLTHFTTCFN